MQHDNGGVKDDGKYRGDLAVSLEIIIICYD